MRFGELLGYMFKVLQARKEWSMAETMAFVAQDLGVTPDALYKWRKGRSLPSLNHLKRLVDIGVNQAELDETWAAELLSLGRHPERSAVLGRLFSVGRSHVPHNLPNRSFLRLVGREAEIAEIRRRLAEESRHMLVAIEGIGGIGKSALALEVAWRYVEEYAELPEGRRFQTVIWTSARREEPKLDMEVAVCDHSYSISNLDEMFMAIGEVLEANEILTSDPKDRRSKVERALRKAGRLLLIVDNLELAAYSEILEFLRALPSPHKAIVTTRFHEDIPYPLRLKGLDEVSMAEFIQQECEARDVVLDEAQRKRVLETTLGLPLAAWWAIGFIAAKAVTADEALDRLRDHTGNSIRFLFGEQVQSLRRDHELAYSILLSLSLFSPESGATLSALEATSGKTSVHARQGLQILLKYNLVIRLGDERYTLIPLTREYVREEIQENPKWDEAGARERWVDWYHRYVARYGGDDRNDEDEQLTWSERFDRLETEWPTLREVFTWCAQRNRTTDLVGFWLDSGVGCFADVRMKWADRIIWYRWLAQEDASADEAEHGAALCALGRTYALTDQFERAEDALNQARQVRASLPLGVRCNIAENRALLYLRQNDIPQALARLDDLERLLTQDARAEPQAGRYLARLYYFRAICKLRDKSVEQVDEAAELFDRAADLCGAIQWQRMELHIQTYRAEIALRRRDLHAAHRILVASLNEARRTEDRRYVARIKTLLAEYEKLRGDPAKARPWAQQAVQELTGLRRERADVTDPGIGVDVGAELDVAGSRETVEERDARELLAQLPA